MSAARDDDHLGRAESWLQRAAAGLGTEADRLACVVELAATLALAARANEGFVDRQRRLWLARLSADPVGQGFVSAMADRVHRSPTPRHAADALRSLVHSLGTPRFLPAAARLPLRVAAEAPVPDGIVSAGLRRAVRLASAGLVHDADARATRRLVEARAAQTTEVNLNLVGEVVLGEGEASARHAAYTRLLRETCASAVSIKLSSIASQIALPSFEDTIAMLAPRLASLYAEALARTPSLLVNLDMEAYDDLDLTLELHRRLSLDPRFAELTTGVVLQAYVPDAHARYESLLILARERAKRGWAPLRVRIVKGANLSMERHLAALRSHPNPIYASKAQTDASWLALTERACDPEAARVLHVGIASHNLFDLAFALVVRAERGSCAEVQLELLEGMADPLRRVLAKLAGPVLVYAPVVAPGDFDAAIAYLVRRLEEATAPGHFLRSSFAMEPGDAAYTLEEKRFCASANARSDVDVRSLRDRTRPEGRRALATPFANEPDTDWALRREREPLLEAMRTVHAMAMPSRTEPLDVVGSIVDGRDITEGRRRPGRDPSRPDIVPYLVDEADRALVERALACAMRSRWYAVDARRRAEHLLEVADGLRRERARLVAMMVLDGGKRVTEADAELSEAVDFAEYYARSALALDDEPHVRTHPLGTVVVASPWNFPLAIGAGGVFAALAAGNAVILKPSPKTPLVARELVRLAHRAGIPTDALALLVMDDRSAMELVRDPRTSAVVLTGSAATARTIARARPEMPLFAETGGKNAMIITATADRDLAIRDAIASAFGHAGQKCSATSLLVCEREVYEDRGFRDRLIDAATSLAVGSAWNPANVVTPLIEPPTGALARALGTLEPGETWLVPPVHDADNRALLSPSIKMGVSAGSFTHQTELFGPVLAVARAETFAQALALANDTPYGLTGAIHALDARQQEQWLAHVEVGNAYVNRGTTGAIVGRQPFGGTKASCFGPGAKAGGPSYVRQLTRLVETETETETHTTPRRVRLGERTRAWLATATHVLDAPDHARLTALAEADAAVFEATFAHPMPTSGAPIPTQRNLLVHTPRRAIALVIRRGDRPFDVMRELVAASTVGAEPMLLYLGECVEPWVTRLSTRLVLLPTEAPALERRLASTRLFALRVLGATAPSDRRPGRADTDRDTEADVLAAAAMANDLRVLNRAPVRASSATLAYWMEERSVTLEDHRYGQALPEALRARVGHGSDRSAR